MSKRKWIGTLSLLISSTIYCQDLGLTEILRRVEEANPEVKIKEYDIEIKKKGKTKALKNLVLPPVELSSEEEWELVKDEGVGLNEVKAYIPIFQGGRVYNTYKKSESEYELAQKEGKLTLFKSQEKAVESYFQALNYRKQREITDRVLKTLEKQRERLSGMYRNGRLVPKSEVLKIEADIENSKAMNMENYRGERNNTERLYQQLDYSLNSDKKLQEFDAEKYLESKGKIEEENRNLESTTVGIAEKLKIENAEYDLKISKADLYPTIYIKPSYKFKDKVWEKGEEKYKTVNDSTLEVGFRYVFAWGATLDTIAQSRYKLEQAKTKYENNMKGLSLEIRDKIRGMEALYGQSLALKKRVNLLSENLEIDNLRYDNGLITTFDYLDSVNKLRVAQEEYYRTQRELVLTTIEYENLYK